MKRIKLNRVLYVLVLVIGITIGGVLLRHPAPAPVVSTPQKVPQTATAPSNAIILAVNQVRTSKGLNGLLESPALDSIALTKAKNMCSDNYWAHDNPNGTKWTDFFKDYPAKAIGGKLMIGENLANGSQTFSLDSIVQAWVGSPEHYRNIVYLNFTESGAASLSCPGFQGVSDDVITVQEFGQPN